MISVFNHILPSLSTLTHDYAEHRGTESFTLVQIGRRGHIHNICQPTMPGACQKHYAVRGPLFLINQHAAEVRQTVQDTINNSNRFYSCIIHNVYTLASLSAFICGIGRPAYMSAAPEHVIPNSRIS